ncbi:MAG: 50S ribosomal protein L11 methyltransferase [Clostridia bacterium]|nr:50S ribosomal protein L11 methyltransferase [Clostridia bacterium]
MKWTQIKVSGNIKYKDDICAVMTMVDQGLMIEDYSDVTDGLNAMYGELLDESIINADKEKVSVSVFISEEKNYAEAVTFLRDRFSLLGIDVVTEVIGVDEADWADAWKQYYKPVKCGKNIVIVPLWEKYDAQPTDVIIKMDPGMAFGTGTHETTRLCLAMMEKHMTKDMTVLDMGTGSGILAIYAAKLGAEKIDAYDIDPVAVKVAKDNFVENGVEDKIFCDVSDLMQNADKTREKYDFVCANIVADIVIRLSECMGDYVKLGGLCAVSGIIDTQAERVKKAVSEKGFVLIDEEKENDWCAFVFKRA